MILGHFEAQYTAEIPTTLSLPPITPNLFAIPARLKTQPLCLAAPRTNPQKNRTYLQHCSHLLSIFSQLFASSLQLPNRGRQAKMKTLQERLVRLIEARRHEPISLEILGEMLGRSPSQTSRLIKRAFGVGLPAYLNHVRVQDAKRLLAETRNPISDIAQTVGFATISHFNRVFRSLTGVTPMQFRRRTFPNL